MCKLLRTGADKFPAFEETPPYVSSFSSDAENRRKGVAGPAETRYGLQIV